MNLKDLVPIRSMATRTPAYVIPQLLGVYICHCEASGHSPRRVIASPLLASVAAGLRAGRLPAFVIARDEVTWQSRFSSRTRTRIEIASLRSLDQCPIEAVILICCNREVGAVVSPWNFPLAIADLVYATL